jgi:hypothetical protein
MSENNCFVYKWTELSTGKWYIGSRTKKGCHINDGYICSSKIVKPLIEKNKNDWVREIIAIGSAKAMREFETKLLQELNASNDNMSYNRSNWGGPVQGAGRKKGSTEKIKASEILQEIDKVCFELYGTNFIGKVVEDYVRVINNKDKKLIKQYENLFYKKQMTITYNGNKIYDYRRNLTE